MDANLLLVSMQNNITSLEGSLATSIKLQVHFLIHPSVSLLGTSFYIDVSFLVCTAGVIYKALYYRIVTEFLETTTSKRDLFLEKQKLGYPHDGILCRCLKRIKIKKKKISMYQSRKISRL